MSLGFGLLSAQLRPGEDPDWERAYDETLQLAVHAERLGYDTVWTTEHHFIDDGYMPSLLVTSAAIAARTERIGIGTGVLLAPMHDPVRIAEDAATVQAISKGRLTLGLGLGWSPIEFDVLGPGKKVRGKALTEVLQILPRAWSGRPFHHAGEIYDLPEIGIRPAPATRIPILVGGGAEAAVRRAARFADGFFANAPVEVFVDQVRWGIHELEKAGRDPADFRWIHYSLLYPATSSEQGWAEIGDDLWHLVWKYSDMVPSATRDGPVPAAPPLTDELRSELAMRTTFVGPADWIVDQLHQIRRAAGVAVEFVARSFFHTLPLDRQTDLMDRIAADVMPHV